MGNEQGGTAPKKKGNKKKKKTNTKNGNNKKKAPATKNGASTNGSTKKSGGGGMGAISEDAEDDGGNNYGFAMNKKLTINDFTFLKVVGKGSFGKVMQVRKNDDGKIYALKVLKKKELVKRKQVCSSIYPLYRLCDFAKKQTNQK